MKETHNIVLLFYIVAAADDNHTADQMRAIGEAGVYEPTFATGERKMLSMVARFDLNSDEACLSATLYALRNARKLYPGAKLWGVETYINGEKKSTSEFPK